MNISEIKPGERVKDVHFSEDSLSVDLMDGRTISVPLAWYPRLLHADAKQRKNWKISGGGFGIHWPDIDEDLSTEGLLRGAPAPHRAMSNVA
ncbi:MAG: DUF2442 domain-containing protein [Desulfobacteraceae bacterium]|nr:DUF2442 domain-containing protein [Desulfobacteraceae bacterium]